MAALPHLLRTNRALHGLAFLHEAPAPDWNDAFVDPSRPLHVDIGTGNGRYIIDLASKEPDMNYLGLDVRPSILEHAWRSLAVAQAEARGDPVPPRTDRRSGAERPNDVERCNVFFAWANFLLPFDSLLSRSVLPDGCKVGRVTLLHPDPCWKTRHHKRRVVSPHFVRRLALHLDEGTPVALQSDLEDIAADMEKHFQESGLFDQAPAPGPPFAGVASAREVSASSRGIDIHRLMFLRNATPAPVVEDDM